MIGFDEETNHKLSMIAKIFIGFFPIPHPTQFRFTNHWFAHKKLTQQMNRCSL